MDSGYMAAQKSKTDEELAKLKDVNPPTFSGVEQSEDVLQWIWENFSAVAGDQPSFECWRMCSSTSSLPLSLILPCLVAYC